MARLRRLLATRYGTTRGGRVDTAAAAQGLGVHQRTVQRWIAGSPRRLAPVPADRLARIVTALTPAVPRLEAEQVEARYARRALAALAERGDAAVLDSWRAQHWMEPHRVVLLKITGRGIRQLATVREDDPARARKLSRRGRVLQAVTVPTRFHARVLVQAVLDQVGPWRYLAQPSDVPAGWTWAWLESAPPVHLASVAAAVQATPRRIRLSNRRGWRLPPDAVRIAAGTRWATPFPPAGTSAEARAAAVEQYRQWLQDQPDLVAAAQKELAHHDLACWCPLDVTCHGDVLLDVANQAGQR